MGRPERVTYDDPVLGVELRYSVDMGLLLLALCILVGPVVAERLRIPGLVGLIAAGMTLGPHVLEWLRPNGFVASIGAAGLLYLMFLAGVELDLKTFAANRTAAITFGLLTFAIPFALAVALASWHLDMSARAAALVGAMWASHTVVAYPEAKAAGLDRNRAVGIAVAATVITDVLALVILAVGASSVADGTSTEPSTSPGDSPLPLWAGLVLLVVVAFVILPRLTRWVFAHVLHSRTQRFVWLLGGMAAGAVVGLLGGVEGLVGAFLAGIGMNTSVPARGELMEQVEFFGDALLVPAFLVSVGLSIDPSALVEPATLRLAALFVAVVVIGKGLAALLAGRLFHFARGETAVMAALTMGQAAATLAVGQVGVATGIFDQEILNAAVVTVVVAVLITSIGTRLAGRSIEAPGVDAGAFGEHVVAGAPGVEYADRFASFVAAVSRADAGLVTPFVVDTVDDVVDAAADGAGDDGAGDHGERRLARFEGALTHLGEDVHGTRRVARTMSDAVLTLSRECGATLIVVPVEGHAFPLDLADRVDIDTIGAESSVPVAIVQLTEREWRRVVVITGDLRGSIQRANDLRLVAEISRRVRAATGLEEVLLAPSSHEVSCFHTDDVDERRVYTPRSGEALDALEPDDLVIVPIAVVEDAGVLGRARLRAALGAVSVVIVGGPGRLRLRRALARRDLGVVSSVRSA